MNEGKDPLPWLKQTGFQAIRASTTTETHEHDYLRFLEPTTLKSLEEWRDRRNGICNTED